MSGFYISLEVWNNVMLAISRFKALKKRALALSKELNKAAELSVEARGQYGAEFPAWSYGSGKLPPYFGDLAKRVRQSQTTRVKQEGGKSETVLDIDYRDFLSIPPDVDKLESFVGDLAERVAKAQREYESFKTRKSLEAASQLQQEQEQVSRMLETLAPEVSSEDRTAIEQRAQEAGESSASRRRALLTQLRLDIQRANAAGQARQREIQQAKQWRERLLGLEGPEVEQLDAALRRVVDGEGPLPPDMGQQVEDVVARATEAANREYALGVITEELENLGYVVETGFETASAQAPEMLLHKPDMEDDYHVSLRVEPGALHNRVVREASDPSEQSAKRERTDEQMERTWCEDLAAALAAAEHRGIRGRAVTRNPPGEVPVPTIAPLKSKPKPKSKRKRRRTDQLKSRVGR